MRQGDIPFSFVNAVVTGEHFIGRHQLLRKLRSNIRVRTNTYIIGLPRMGKTSLVKQCFFLEENYKEWLEIDHFVPIYVSVDTSNNSSSLWKSLAREIWKFLRKQNKNYKFLDDFRTISSTEDLYQTVMMALECIKDELGLSFVIILDEFDGVRRYPAVEGFFQKIRDLNEYGVVVTCSRRTPIHIEELSTGTHYFTDSGKQIYVGLFNEDDILEYWEHFKLCFSGFTEKQFESYKKLVKSYVGNHPMLMSLMNYWLFSQETGSNVWNPKMPSSQRKDYERSIRVMVKDAFLRQMDYVEEQHLKTAAIQLVVGTSRAIPDEEVDLLLQYQFVRTVPVQEKERIFGYELGPTTADQTNRYVCFSDLTTHIMKDLYDPDIQGFELLREMELKLREVITRYLTELCDGDPFRIVTISGRKNREIWEQVLFNRISYFRNNTPHSIRARDAFKADLDKMYEMKKLRASYDCKPTFDRRMINEVTSTTLGQLWHVFIKWQWREFFSRLFVTSDMERWHEDVFVPILDWRNAADHHNDDELPDGVIEYASDRAREVIRRIQEYLGTVSPRAYNA